MIFNTITETIQITIIFLKLFKFWISIHTLNHWDNWDNCIIKLSIFEAYSIIKDTPKMTTNLRFLKLILISIDYYTGKPRFLYPPLTLNFFYALRLKAGTISWFDPKSNDHFLKFYKMVIL
jgi:hypothetical protein